MNKIPNYERPKKPGNLKPVSQNNMLQIQQTESLIDFFIRKQLELNRSKPFSEIDINYYDDGTSLSMVSNIISEVVSLFNHMTKLVNNVNSVEMFVNPEIYKKITSKFTTFGFYDKNKNGSGELKVNLYDGTEFTLHQISSDKITNSTISLCLFINSDIVQEFILNIIDHTEDQKYNNIVSYIKKFNNSRDKFYEDYEYISRSTNISDKIPEYIKKMIDSVEYNYATDITNIIILVRNNNIGIFKNDDTLDKYDLVHRITLSDESIYDLIVNDSMFTDERDETIVQIFGLWQDRIVASCKLIYMGDE